MRYQDFQELMRPKNKEFQSYVKRKLAQAQDSDHIISASQETEAGLTFPTHQKVGKLWEDMLTQEN